MLNEEPPHGRTRPAGAGMSAAVDSQAVFRTPAVPMPADLASCDTFPKLLRRNARIRADRPAIREKDLGIWQTWTWAAVDREVTDLAAGFAALGLTRGDRVAIVGDNRPRLYWSFTAAQMLGAVPVPVYQDAVADEMQYVLDHAEVRVAMAEDQEQVDKLLSIRGRIPTLDLVIYDDPRGMRHYSDPALLAFDQVQARGAAFAHQNPDHVEREIAAGAADDLGIMLYTSGTTGTPKGVMLSNRNLIISAFHGCAVDGLTADDETLAYLPMAWVGDNLFSLSQSHVSGFCVACPESGATVMTDLREIGPTYFFAPPRIFESILTSVMVRMEDAGWLKRTLFRYFMDVARRHGNDILDGRPVPPGGRLLYAIGTVLVYGPLKNALGFSRIRVGYTAGEAIGPDIFRFYRSLGINLKQLYGSTEASVYITMQPDGDIRPDTVGKPAPAVEVRIADDGEVLFRSPGVFLAYYKNDQATAATKTADGWVRTGDAGLFDSDGHLRIIDRARDVGRLVDGTLFAPKYIENKLKFYPDIREAVAFGDGRAEVCAFINIDLTAMGSWAERNTVGYASYGELAAHPKVAGIIAGHVARVNRDLAADPQFAGSQIHRFLILHKELDADDGELTRTRKVRRRFIAERYAALIEALYDGAGSGHIDVEVTYEDGRKGRLAADLVVHRAETFPAAAAARRLAG